MKRKAVSPPRQCHQKRPAGTVMSGSLNLLLSSQADTARLGRTIGRALKGGEVLALIGDLGAGKTALVKGVAAGIHAPKASVSSPTFVLMHHYHGRLPLVHVDFYRLRTQSDAENIGLHEYFDGTAVTAIEWADRFPALLPDDRLEVRLRHKSPTVRTVELSAHGPQALQVLQQVREDRRPSRRVAGHSAKTPRRRKATTR
jgi:tRNA threonylcarbamoyladenosine biosynthesis protein TsaE